jgi:hypothetical protein
VSYAPIHELDIALPRPIVSLHQIEVSSRCSLRCVYCTSPSIVAGKYPNRPSVDMSRETFEAALEHVKFFLRRGTQGELNLAGIGESFLNENFLTFVELAREAHPFGHILLATNGLHLTEAIAKELARLKTRLWVSLHRPEKAGLAVSIAKTAGILDGVSMDPALNSDSWADQVAWPKAYVAPIQCHWIRAGWCMVMAHGQVTSCCLDAQGLGVIGHVNDTPGALGDKGTWVTKPYKLCASCQQVLAIKGHVQHPEATP